MATLDTARTSGVDRAFDALAHATTATIEGRASYPSGTVFVPAGLPDSGVHIAEAMAAERPVVIVDAEGAEHLVRPSDHALVVTTLIGILTAVVAGLRAGVRSYRHARLGERASSEQDRADRDSSLVG